MTTYVALLRGINVGGKNMVSMKLLKASFEQLGFDNVQTYINSGNVLFRAGERDARKLEERIDRLLVDEYRLKGKTVVRSHAELARLVKVLDRTWRESPEWRYNVVFLRHGIDSKRLVAELAPTPELEEIVYCPGALLWSVRADSGTRATLMKLPGKVIYQDMTVRNVKTTRKILALMELMNTTGQREARA